MKPLLPKKFYAYIGGYPGPHYEIKWQDSVLKYAVTTPDSPLPKTQSIQPTDSQWQAFWNRLDDLGVWDWKRKYDSDICDGTQWDIDLRIGSKRIRSSGSNSYPCVMDEEGSMSETFEKYLEAIHNILGGLEFN